MSRQTIEITVTPDGKTTIQTRGFVGSSCQDASRFIEQALGQRADEKLSAEFYQTQPVQQSQKQQT
jgi:hypothetical protein